MREFRQQLVSALLVIVTVAAVVAAAINFQQQSKFALPDDGVAWVDQIGSDLNSHVVAAYVTPGSPAAQRDLRKGDVLVSIEDVRMDNALEATQVLARLGSWREAKYDVQRGG